MVLIDALRVSQPPVSVCPQRSRGDAVATIRGNARGNTLNGTDTADVMFGLGGDDRVSGGAGADLLYGDDDSLVDPFGSGKDKLDGGEGNDLLVGGSHRDSLTGGAGDDMLIGGLASADEAFAYTPSLAVDGGDDSYNGGEGFDRAVLIYAREAAIAFDILANRHAITGDGARIGTIAGVEAVTAWLGWGDDAVTGGASGDELHGRDGDDVLAGSGGADRIDGGAGDDRLSGGEGFDTLSYADAAAGVTIDLGRAGEAQDTIGAGVDTFDGFEQVDGSAFSDRLIGGAGDDFMTAGNGGGDRLGGGAGDDHLSIARFATDVAADSTLNGGEGDDVLSVAMAAGVLDRVTVIGGGGDDTANLLVSARQSVSMGVGEDRVVLALGVGEVAITLGKGVDTVTFDAAGGVPEGQTAAHVHDFAAGNNGDRIDLRDLLAEAATGYQPGSNPFAGGFVRLIAGSGGTDLQFDADGAGGAQAFVTVLALDGVQPQAFTAFNFGGTDPLGALPIADRHWPAELPLA